MLIYAYQFAIFKYFYIVQVHIAILTAKRDKSSLVSNMMPRGAWAASMDASVVGYVYVWSSTC